MINKISRSFSSIGFKIFLSFWLFALTTIIVTRFISAQIAQSSIVIPAHHGDQQKLNRLAKRFDRENTSPTDIFQHRRKAPHEELIIKDIENGQVTSTKKRFLRDPTNYLEINSFSTITSVQFSQARITGPKEITLEGRNVQLYLASRDKSRHFDSFIMQLPNWLKLAIPIFVSSLLAW